MNQIIIFLLVLPVLVHCCDKETQYEKDGLCCKMCGPGKRMKQTSDCMDPSCEECAVGEYQDRFTTETSCTRQPICDRNLHFELPESPSKTERSPCKCITDYHCADEQCMSCQPNKVCKPGERVSKAATPKTDTKCEPCSHGTFSSGNASNSCVEWIKCPLGHVEFAPGSPTSDRICGLQENARLGVCISLGILFTALVGFVVLYCFYKKGTIGSACLEKKKSLLRLNNHPPAEDNVIVENEQLVNIQPINVPQEDTEDPTKPDEFFKHGLSANGMPVDQDHSKTSIISHPETNPSGITYSG